MVLLLAVTFINLFVTVFSAVLLLRIILSYVLEPYNRFMGFIVSITEPLLAPVRKLLPAVAGIDFSLLAVLFLLQMVQKLVTGLLLQ